MTTANPLKLDPSRTALIRRQFVADMGRRFDLLRRKVWKYVNTDNVVGLTANVGPPDEARDAKGEWTSEGASGKLGSASIEPLKDANDADTASGEIEDRFGEVEDRNSDNKAQGIIEIQLALTGEGHKVVARSGGKVVGAVSYEPDDKLRTLKVVHLGSTGEVKGVGTQLLNKVVSQARRIGYGVSGQVRPGAEGFYRKLGIKLDKEGNFSLSSSFIMLNSAPTTNAPFIFQTDSQKLTAFNKWLQDQINKGILEINPTTGEPKNMRPWMYKYVDSAYKKGALRAYTDVHQQDLSQPEGFYEGTKQAFLESAFGRPERVDKLKLLYTRAYENLKGVTSTMGSQISRIMADSMAHGKGPADAARLMSKTITGISRARANTIARSESIHAHAEGQLDGMEDLGIEEVGAEVEFVTSGDDSVCPICQSLEGEVFTIDEARGKIPQHVNCRCSWSPVVKSAALGNA